MVSPYCYSVARAHAKTSCVNTYTTSYFLKSRRLQSPADDKYLFKKEIMDATLHEYDALIVNNKYTEKYFRRYMRFKGGIKVLYHHSDPRWQGIALNPHKGESSLHPSTLKFGYIGTINPSSLDGNFLFMDILKERYNIVISDTTGGSSLPLSVKDHQMDINLRQLNSTFARFKPSTKVSLAFHD